MANTLTDRLLNRKHINYKYIRAECSHNAIKYKNPLNFSYANGCYYYYYLLILLGDVMMIIIIIIINDEFGFLGV